MRSAILALVILGGPCLLFGQSETDIVHHHNIVFGAGPAIPTGNANGYLSTAPLIRLGYGYRFNRLFQADIGFIMAFGAANNQNAEVTGFGNVQGGDHEFIIPIGGRVYIPLPVKRIQTSVGVGAAHLHYSETAPSNGGGYGYGYGGYSSGCYSCSSRGGWGGYGLGNVSYFLDSGHNFRVGATLQYIAGSTNGAAVANFPATKTTDRWLNLAFDFGVSF